MSLKLVVVATILLVGFEQPTNAHDIYSQLKDRWENSCCDDKDCWRAPYQVAPTGVRMLVDGDWIASGLEYTTHCAILPPSLTAFVGPSFARLAPSTCHKGPSA